MQENPGAQVLATVLKDPGRPRITWYGPDDERVELSGAVLANWVNKTANLLLEEFDASAGDRILLDLPGHWRTAVWALAAWRVGACVVLEGRADVSVTTRPELHPSATGMVVVTLAALARRHPEPVPAGALDAAADLMSYGDQLVPVPPWDGSAPAFVDGVGRAVTGDELVEFARSSFPWEQRSRCLVPAVSPALASTATLAALACDGSLILVDPDLEASWRDTGYLARIVSSEAVTAWQN